MSVTPILPHNIPTVLFDDTPRARRKDKLTSHAAADGTATKRKDTHRLIEWALENQSPMTAQGIIEFLRQQGFWVSESRVTTSMKELRSQGTVEEADTLVNPKSGYKATAYRLTDEVDA